MLSWRSSHNNKQSAQLGAKSWQSLSRSLPLHATPRDYERGLRKQEEGEADMNKVDQVCEVFGGIYDDVFVAAMLLHMDQSVEHVIEALLEKKIPPTLMSMNRSAPLPSRSLESSSGGLGRKGTWRLPVLPKLAALTPRRLWLSKSTKQAVSLPSSSRAWQDVLLCEELLEAHPQDTAETQQDSHTQLEGRRQEKVERPTKKIEGELEEHSQVHLCVCFLRLYEGSSRKAL